MYPLKFTKVLKEKVWGGRGFESFLGIGLEAGKSFGESWEVSAHPNGPSVVAEGPWAGKSLPELMAEHGAALVGRDLYTRFQGKFPLLIKYLDIHDKLSIQVHPDDAYALAHEGEFGKSECWYVLTASPDAKLIVGMAPGVDAATFARKSKAGQWDGLFREVPVAAGDFLHVTPGTVHASLTGSVLICEVQQNSDTTYRIYDFDRLENGKLRPLHLDKALDVIEFAAEPRLSHPADRRRVDVGGATVEALVKDPYYTVDRVEVTAAFHEKAEDRFRVFSILEGKGTLVHGGTDYPVKAGETWLLPAGLDVRVKAPTGGRVTVLRSVV
jgi:mannose-6-phosphate isomerase